MAPTSEGDRDMVVWPLKSSMNLVWPKLSLSNVTDTMHKAAKPLINAEITHEDDSLEINYKGLLFTHRFNYWIKQLVASQKCPYLASR
jgi:hypothetical protein